MAMAMSTFLGLIVAASWLSGAAHAAGSHSYNGLALTPQMGWDNWNAFACDINETTLLMAAEKIVDYGLRDLGYNYIVLDDCWSNGRTDNGSLQYNVTKFPHGMKYVGDQLHSMGLKFGMYSSAGTYTCAQYAASLGKEKIDAQTFASWGVDYLKYDNCYNEGQEGNSLITYTRYKAMSDALNATGRPILYSMCNWGTDYPWNWAQTIANSWRITGDIYDSFDRADARCPCTTWDCNLPGFHCSVMNILNKVAPIANKGQPGAWNDLDILEVGNSGMTDEEYKTHISMWALVKSPLLMGNDLNQMDPATLSLLSNPALLAISQDPLGLPVLRVWQKPAVTENNTYSAALYTEGALSFWTGQLNGGDFVVAFVNSAPPSASVSYSYSPGQGQDTGGQQMTADYDDIFIDQVTTGSSAPVNQLQMSWDIYDVWGYRMDNTTAQAIIQGNASSLSPVLNSTASIDAANLTIPTNSSSSGDTPAAAMRYNATALPYAEGVRTNVTAVLGKKVGVLEPGQQLTVQVPSHGVVVYRLRSRGMTGSGGMRKRDEL